MNDFDDSDLGRAITARADAAPATVPDFASVLADRQSRMRRRTAVVAVGIVALGITGVAALAARGADPASTADGPSPADSLERFATTTVSADLVGADGTIWYCEGAIDRSTWTDFYPTTTTIAPIPETTIGPTGIDVEATSTVPEYAPPIEDSGYFRSCVVVDDPLVVNYPASASETTTTTMYPATTITEAIAPSTEPDQPPPPDATIYVVKSGDYLIKIATDFCVPLEDLLAINGWESGNELGFPGDTVLIPLPDPDAVCAHTVTTVEVPEITEG